MISRNDPRVRRAIDQITQNFETANERTQEGIFTFTQSYLRPCFASIGEYTSSCTTACCPGDEERRKRHRLRTRQTTRGHAESSFDFYDDWEADETDALLGLTNEEINNRAGPSTRQPQRTRQMSYGTTSNDIKNIHSSSYFGFLERFPFRLGAKGFTYKPSIADLQDHPGGKRQDSPKPQDEQSQNSVVDDTHQIAEPSKLHKRNRSSTQTSNISRLTTDSFSSRGDIFPSEDEMDDAVLIDEELAFHLERRVTDHGMESSTGSISHNSHSQSSFTIPNSGHSPKTKRRRPPPTSHSSSSLDIRHVTPETLEVTTLPNDMTQNSSAIDMSTDAFTVASNSVTTPEVETNLKTSEPTNEPTTFNAAALPHFSST